MSQKRERCKELSKRGNKRLKRSDIRHFMQNITVDQAEHTRRDVMHSDQAEQPCRGEMLRPTEDNPFKITNNIPTCRESAKTITQSATIQAAVARYDKLRLYQNYVQMLTHYNPGNQAIEIVVELMTCQGVMDGETDAKLNTGDRRWTRPDTTVWVDAWLNNSTRKEVAELNKGESRAAPVPSPLHSLSLNRQLWPGTILF